MPVKEFGLIRLPASYEGYGHTACVRLLVDRGSNVNTQNNNGHTALSRAATYGHTNTVYDLMKMGADPNIPDTIQRVPLHYACVKGHIGCAENLILGGANLNAKVLI